MKESFEYRQLSEGLKEQHSKQAVPLTAGEHEIPDRPMTIQDTDRSLRFAIQRMTMRSETTEDDGEAAGAEIMRLSELLTPELRKQFGDILRTLHERASQSEKHPRREYLSTDEPELDEKITAWVDQLKIEMHTHRPDLTPEDEAEIEALTRMLFEAHVRVYNARTFEADVRTYDKDHAFDQADEDAAISHDKALVQELHTRASIDKDEAELLLKLIRVSDKPGDEYNMSVLVDTIRHVMREYDVGKYSKEISIISLGNLLSKAMDSFAPSLFEHIIVDNKFRAEVFLEYFGITKLASIVQSRIDIEAQKLELELNRQLNARIVNSLFFQEFEFIHDKSLGELYATLERGKSATVNLIQEVTTQLGPTIGGIGMSLGFLMKLNPVLGALGVANLPMMYYVARNWDQKFQRLHEHSWKDRAAVTNELDTMVDGFEQMRTSPNVPEAASTMEGKMNQLDELAVTKAKKMFSYRITRDFPHDVTVVTAAIVGGVLQSMGQISGGAILSNMMYTRQLNGPVEGLIDQYYSQFARNVQDIKRMEEGLGKYEELDLPEGKKERNRTPVSELPDYTITIDNLKYKNIIRGFSEEFEQGEFVTIAGPSGAGKTTLLRNIVGLLKNDQDAIKIGGVPVGDIRKYGKDSLHTIMAYSNQRPQIFPMLTLRENLLLWSGVEVSDENIRTVLEDLGLDKLTHKLDEKPKFLSGGEQVRVGVARALLKDPKILLLDEPTASLDSQSAAEVNTILQKMRSKYGDLTIVCVSHDETLIKLGDRVVNMGT